MARRGRGNHQELERFRRLVAQLVGCGRGNVHGIAGPEDLVVIIEPDRADAVQDVVKLLHGAVQMTPFGAA